MNRQKKIELNNQLIATWYDCISTQQYFDYWLDYFEMEKLIQITFPTTSRTYIHNAFWKHVFLNKKFLNAFEY